MSDNSGLLLRKATATELDIVLHHRRQMFLDMHLAGDYEQAEILSREFFGRALTEGNYHGWFYEDAGVVVAGGGVVLVEYHPSPTDPHPRRPWVVNVYVEQPWWRRGLARRLMDVMIEWTRAQGYPNLLLHASDDGRGV